uniref:Uncharacterized protein n=1 Tax=Arundo donax TaxID=35708 RepID=A0A0A9ETP6_ARUDO
MVVVYEGVMPSYQIRYKQNHHHLQHRQFPPKIEALVGGVTVA